MYQDMSVIMRFYGYYEPIWAVVSGADLFSISQFLRLQKKSVWAMYVCGQLSRRFSFRDYVCTQSPFFHHCMYDMYPSSSHYPRISNRHILLLRAVLLFYYPFLCDANEISPCITKCFSFFFFGRTIDNNSFIHTQSTRSKQKTCQP